MRRKKGRHAGTESRRKDIINAALSCFSEIGFSETSMEDIRRRSGASTGSIYHHFRSKEQLAAEVYIEGIRNYQEALIQALKGCEGAREGIGALVSSHLQWVRENIELSRYLFQKRHSVFMASAEEEIAAMNRSFGQNLSHFFAGHIKGGVLKPLPSDIIISLIFGPCMELTRQYFSGHSGTPLDKAAGILSEAVWRALSTDRG
ncbi:MAG TPA: TetR/AcrR family transcriptional regulator [Deltaproteobacteria bacterium]|jgi:AcrR family transcriptional regulator|nr:TetR/AcrR family transcriptional regulator [Deltaproteobacteria bacterium]